VREDGGLIKLSTVHLNGHVEITIEDNGMGIDPVELKAIFDPKFVPRAGKIRTSWGLATTQQILLQHKGQLEMQSLPGQGTRVKVTLPAT
jgi:signal transduction histidine kinase